MSQEKTVLKDMARKRGGVYSGGLFSAPKLTLKLNNADVVIFFKKEKGGQHTRMEYRLPSKKIKKLALYPQRYGSLSVIPGDKVQDILTGDAGFDRQYLVQGKDSSQVQEFLSDQIRARLLEMKELYPVLKIDDGHFQFYAPKVLASEEEISLFVDAGFESIRQALKF